MSSDEDYRWMGAALALASRGVGRTGVNPSVSCVLVKAGRVVGRGRTADGGRPHAEAAALAAAGDAAAGATAYVTLEPCAHASPRGPHCSGLLVAAGVARVVVALVDPDPRTAGQGLARLRDAGIAVTAGVREAEARAITAGFLTRQQLGRPQVTLKLALSLDGCVALADGNSQWLTGPAARAHAHLERSRHETILIGRGTWEKDRPSLDVRLPGLAGRSPRRALLSASPFASPPGDDWTVLTSPDAVADLAGNHVLVEGGAGVAASLLAADMVDRMLLYRAPVVVGGGRRIGDIGLTDLAAAHGRWRRTEARPLGADLLEVYERTR